MFSKVSALMTKGTLLTLLGLGVWTAGCGHDDDERGGRRADKAGWRDRNGYDAGYHQGADNVRDHDYR